MAAPHTGANNFVGVDKKMIQPIISPHTGGWGLFYKGVKDDLDGGFELLSGQVDYMIPSVVALFFFVKFFSNTR
jgi:hypothetical protein